MDSQDIFSASIPYYDLFDFSIDDVYDDLNIIFFHKNYRVEPCKACLKLFFNVFSIGGQSPYTEIFIRALNRERTDKELFIKMERYFSEYKKVNNNKDCVNNNNKNRKEKKINNENKKENKKINKENYSENFLNSFIQLKNVNN